MQDVKEAPLMRAAVDVGHYAVKAYAGSSLVFPALIAPAPPTVDLGPLGGRDPCIIVREDGADAASYWIGDAAQHLAAPVWTRDKGADPWSRVLLYESLRRLGLPSGSVAVAVGLPLGWFASHRAALEKSLLGRRVSLESGGIQHRWTITAVRVLPQGVAAALTAIKQGLVPVAGLYALVDVGYRTVDVVVLAVDDAGRPHGRPQWSTTLDLGWHVIDSAVIRGLRAQYPGADFLPAQVQGSHLTVFGQSVNLRRWQEPAVRSLGQRITSAVQTNLGDIWAQLEGVILVGGGAVAIHEALQWDGLSVRVADQPTFANVLGYWDALQGVTGPPAPSHGLRSIGPV